MVYVALDMHCTSRMPPTEESRERYIDVRDRGLRALNQAINDPYLSSPAYRCEKEGGKGVLSSHKRPISESSSIFRSFNNKT